MLERYAGINLFLGGVVLSFALIAPFALKQKARFNRQRLAELDHLGFRKARLDRFFRSGEFRLLQKPIISFPWAIAGTYAGYSMVMFRVISRELMYISSQPDVYDLIYVRLPGMTLPRFLIGPRSISRFLLDWGNPAMKQDEINIPTLSGNYVVYGKQSDNLHHFITPSLIHFLSRKIHAFIETDAHGFLFFVQNDKARDGEPLEPYLKRAAELARLFQR